MNYQEVIDAFKSREKVLALIPVGDRKYGQNEWAEAVITTIRSAVFGGPEVLKEVTVVTLEHFQSQSHTYCGVGEITTHLRKIEPKCTELQKAEERILSLQSTLTKEIETHKMRCDQLDATVRALDLLKKEIGAKASALEGMPARDITADVIVRHVAALRRLS